MSAAVEPPTSVARSSSYQAERTAELVSRFLGSFARQPTFSGGKKEDVLEWLASLRAAFTLHGIKETDDATRMTIALQLLRGKAASVVADWQARCKSRFDTFAVRMEDSFDYRNPHKAIDAIVQTRQGTGTFPEYLRAFEAAVQLTRKLPEETKTMLFIQGLNEVLRLKLFETMASEDASRTGRTWYGVKQVRPWTYAQVVDMTVRSALMVSKEVPRKQVPLESPASLTQQISPPPPYPF